MNPIISISDLYTLAKDQPIGIPILADVVYSLKRAPGMSGKELTKRLDVKMSYLQWPPRSLHLIVKYSITNQLRDRTKPYDPLYRIRRYLTNPCDTFLHVGRYRPNHWNTFLHLGRYRLTHCNAFLHPGRY